MPTVTSDVLLLTYAGVKTVFAEAYQNAQENAKWKLIADEIPTTLPIQNYAWLGRGAVMKEFKDEVEEQSVREDSYIIQDKTYKANLAIDRRTIEDDQYGQIMMKARQLAGEPTRHWNQLAFTGLTYGFTGLCYDGFSFFNANHQEGVSPVQSNVTGASLSDAALQAAEAAMMGYVDDKGIPLEIMPNTLVVGPALKRKAEDLVGSAIVVTRVGDGAAGPGATSATDFSNYFQGKFAIVVNPYIGGSAAYNWFLLDNSRGVKPIVIQSRSDVPITLETDMDDPTAKIKERYQVTARGRYAQAYGLWQTAYGSSASS